MRKKQNKYRGIAIDSRLVQSGDLFIAIKGSKNDGHKYIDEACGKGAAICVTSQDNWPKHIKKIANTRIITVRDTREELSRRAAEFYGNPTNKMIVTGITGTNGKTTIAFLLDEIISGMGRKTGMIGTIYYKIGNKIIPADRTTPDSLRLNIMLAEMIEEKTKYLTMEVSSHSLDQKRVGHVFFDAAVFTNITREHLDYHKNMKAYFKAKASIFKNLKKKGTAIINKDDHMSRILTRSIRKKKLTFSTKSDKADIYAKDIVYSLEGSSFTVVTPKKEHKIRTKLVGRHNISNILAALSVCYSYGLDLEWTAELIAQFNGAPGRLESIESSKPYKIFVDYAHTDDALKNVIAALRPYVKNRLITIFGCGGDRDRTKRPRMGRVSTVLSDYTIITSDNPRSEDPKAITAEIEKGVIDKKAGYEIIIDRREAIKAAIDMAKEGDIILVAGKGHETEQIIGDKTIIFDDRQVVRSLLMEH